MDHKQEAALQSMRDLFLTMSHSNEVDEKIAKEYCTDETFMRYLRARNFDVTKAAALLRASLAWRRDFDVHGLCKDNLSQDILAIENSTGKLYARGIDQSGHVMLYMKPRNENTNNHDGNCKHLVYNLERAIAIQNHLLQKQKDAETEVQAHPQSSVQIATDGKVTLIIDYLGFSLRNSPPMKTSTAVLNILQNHYPERLFRAYIIRPPWVFSTFWSMISPFVDPVTKEKIVFVGPHDIPGIRHRLGSEIDVAHLEQSVGGDDVREFNSIMYLSSPFHHDFLLSLSLSESEHGPADNSSMKEAQTNAV